MNTHLRPSAALVVIWLAGLVPLAGCSDDAETAEPATTSGEIDHGDSVDLEVVDDVAGGDTAADADEGDGESDVAVADICEVISEDEIAAIVGGAVTKTDSPGGGCSFGQSDLYAPSIAFGTIESSSDDDGTFNEVRYGSFAQFSDPSKDDPQLGEYSAVATGTTGGENQQAVGVVEVGNTVVQVMVMQGSGLDAATVKGFAVSAMTLAVSKLS